MIRQLRGKVVSQGVASVVIEVVGFGIEVKTATPGAFATGEEVTLATHLAVKQDGMDLYGFAEAAERDFFEKLLNVSGVGPKTALGVLRRAPREAVESAIAARDLSYLTKVVGLGKKLAEKLMVELSEKMTPATRDGADTEVFETLVALGYTEKEARHAVQRIPETVTGKDARLREALRST